MSLFTPYFLTTTPCENELFAGDGQIAEREGSHNVKIHAENLTCREVQPAKKKNHAAELLLNIVYRGTEKSFNNKADAIKPTSAYMLIVIRLFGFITNHYANYRLAVVESIPRPSSRQKTSQKGLVPYPELA